MKRNFGLAPSELPLLPPLRARAMAALWNPRAEIHDFLSMIEADPGLTATVLRAANSAYSAPRDPIHAARDAIVRIGLDATRRFTSAAVMRSQFEHLDQAGLNVTAFWSRQLAVGLLTEEFARDDQRSEVEISSAFVAGLLHRAGRLPLAVRSPDRYRAVVGLVREGAAVLDAERQSFGIDSMLMTRHVATRWSLPDAIADALSRQDDLEAEGLPRLLREAIAAVDLFGFDEGFDETFVGLSLLPADHPRAALLNASGGADGLRARVQRISEASEDQPAPSPRLRKPAPRVHATSPEAEPPVLPRAA